MAKEAHDLEAFFIQNQAVDLANKAWELAEAADAAGFSKITKSSPNVELPQGMRTETVTTGTMTKSDFKDAFSQKGIHVSPYAQDLIDKIELTTKPEEVTVAWRSGRELGLKQASPFRRFIGAGVEGGLYKLHPEVGLYLRLQDLNQPLNDWYWMAMEPITDRLGFPRVWELGRSSDGLWLRGAWTRLDARWGPGDRLVFGFSK